MISTLQFGGVAEQAKDVIGHENKRREMRRKDELSKRLYDQGWIEFMPENEHGWRFFFRRNNEPPHPYFGPGYDYKTLYPCGDTADGIVETPYQRWVRQKQEILFRDFRGVRF